MQLKELIEKLQKEFDEKGNVEVQVETEEFGCLGIADIDTQYKKETIIVCDAFDQA